MTSKTLDWVGQRGVAVVTVIAALAAINVIAQVVMHKTTPLTAWKGGGFGMYTEPHPDFRSVVLTIDDGAAQLVLWPEGGNVSEWAATLGPQGQAAVLSLQDQAGRLRYYPRDGQTRAVLARAARFRWDASLLGDVTPAAGKTFAPERLSLWISEQTHSLSGAVERTPVYCLGQGC